jgi:peptidoglycan/LPS O-acetylase OafA/YrhL
MSQITLEQPSKQRLHLAYLDGLRGLAAFYVVLVHCWDSKLVLEPVWAWVLVTKFLRYGIFAVVIFIVLSGYCLMLPVVRSRTGSLSGGLRQFFQRRIRRILPPYYAAIVLCMLLGISIQWLQDNNILNWSNEGLDDLNSLFSPVFSLNDVLAYVLLIQNFGLNISKINGPTWTVAVEWQIYFVFAVLLIPIWRRLGSFSTVAIASSLGLALKYLMGEISFNVCPWFLGLFALGMAAADINFSQKLSLIRLKKTLPWRKLAAIFAFFAFLTEWLRFSLITELPEWVVHYCVALATSCFLIYCTKFLTADKPLPSVIRFLESKWIVILGGFSYSLYITHAPIVWITYQFLLNKHLSPTMFTVSWFLIAVPSSLIFAYLFHQVFERPFMSSFSSNLKSHSQKYI